MFVVASNVNKADYYNNTLDNLEAPEGMKLDDFRCKNE